MSFIDQIAELEKAKAKLALAQAKLAADRVAALAKLPSEYGYANLNDFIKALKEAALKGGKGKSKAGKGAKAPKAAKAAKGKRAKITAEVKAEVKALVDAGKTGQEIAKALGISQPSVQNIKKELGLVKARAAAPSAVVESAPAQA
ncbi:mucin [Verrucomicrobia bacterium IMCC26134]|jgi:DNA-binding NarL/FixJ family response regulator|nr:mucin [Verrucomicrobia bacterium IMCC26134]